MSLSRQVSPGPSAPPDGSVTAEKLADGSVDTSKIADDAVTASKLADDSVYSAAIQSGAVTSQKIADNAVRESAIQNDAVTAGKIYAGAVTAAKIANDAVTEDKIQDGAVTDSKIESISYSKISDPPDVVTLSDATPAALGVASPGVATSASRADHVHATPSLGISDVTGLVTALAGKSDTSHGHTLAAISDAGGAAALNVGTGAGTVAAGDHTHSLLPSSDQKDALGGTSGTPSSSNKYVTDADARNTNARTPSAHATSHRSGGSDAIKLDDLAAPDDNTDLDVSITKHGLAPKAPNETTKFLRGDAAWAIPNGGTSNALKIYDTVGDLPAAADHSGAVAGVGQTNSYYFSDGSSWTRVGVFVNTGEKYTSSGNLTTLGGTIDATSGSITLTLPPLPGGGEVIFLARIDSSGNTVTLLCSGADTIDSAASITMAAGESRFIVADSNGARKTIHVGKITGAPLTHATSHKSGGSDAVKLDELAAPTDVTTLDVSTSAHGLVPKAPNDTTKFLRGDATWAVPLGGLAQALTINGFGGF